MHLATRRGFLGFGFGAALGAATSSPALTPDRAHLELIQGTRRFVSGHATHPHASLSWIRRAGRTAQHPHAVILCCSDSRVVPELIFDRGIGDLFVVRVAGNVANGDEVGSIEYAVEHLDVPLCVVLGHTGCGAVQAVVDGAKLPAEIEHLVAPIQSAFAEVMKKQSPSAPHDQLVLATVERNVQDTVRTIAGGHTVVGERVLARRLRVEGAVYHLDSGAVTWLPALK